MFTWTSRELRRSARRWRRRSTGDRRADARRRRPVQPMSSPTATSRSTTCSDHSDDGALVAAAARADRRLRLRRHRLAGRLHHPTVLRRVLYRLSGGAAPPGCNPLALRPRRDHRRQRRVTRDPTRLDARRHRDGRLGAPAERLIAAIVGLRADVVGQRRSSPNVNESTPMVPIHEHHAERRDRRRVPLTGPVPLSAPPIPRVRRGRSAPARTSAEPASVAAHGPRSRGGRVGAITDRYRRTTPHSPPLSGRARRRAVDTASSNAIPTLTTLAECWSRRPTTAAATSRHSPCSTDASCVDPGPR